MDNLSKIRFLLLANTTRDKETGCWLWNGSIQNNGYSSTRFLGRRIPSHRASYLSFVGEIGESLEVCHKCDVRNCINPDHLYLATHQQNMLDMKARGRARNGVMSGAYEPSRNELGQFEQIRKKNGK